MFITFEGPEGAGKTTQISRVHDFLKNRGISCIAVREPGGTNIGNRIRELLLDPKLNEMKQRTEILLYAASRTQLVEEVILPELASGKVVLCDRYVDSSIAYQGYGANWNIDEVVTINQIATGRVLPDRTYLLDIPVQFGQKRLQIRGDQKDRIELKEKLFHTRVREGYLQLAKEEPNRFQYVDATGDVEEVYQQIIADLSLLLPIKE
ncbi:dTMP kinase [Hazenella coriacea]|uniref:Thymidylate kinase n=1 Tax=Hazenella coriacea TaxID=1179467 RepID=A0A4R3L5M5_9BACL|nr:dTMP kinase [Hazenella coriacea]TCS94328.1 dTMP kinase [Hazenella coriacea]